MTRKKSPTPRKRPSRKPPPRKRVPREKKGPGPAEGSAASSPNGTAPDGPPEPPPPPSDLPFDAKYFEEQFPNLLNREGEATPKETPKPFLVTIVLGDGMTQLDVQAIERLDQHWMLVAALDEDGRPGSLDPARRYVFVPYAAIARVEVTGTESRLRPIGFHYRAAVKAKKIALGKKKTTKKNTTKKTTKKSKKKTKTGTTKRAKTTKSAKKRAKKRGT